jgi:hypothetical protein
MPRASELGRGGRNGLGGTAPPAPRRARPCVIDARCDTRDGPTGNEEYALNMRRVEREHRRLERGPQPALPRPARGVLSGRTDSLGERRAWGHSVAQWQNPRRRTPARVRTGVPVASPWFRVDFAQGNSPPLSGPHAPESPRNKRGAPAVHVAGALSRDGRSAASSLDA